MVKYSFAYVYDKLKSAGLPEDIDMFSMCHFASKYGLGALEAHCIDKLIKTVNISNACELLQFAQENSYVSLKYHIMMAMRKSPGGAASCFSSLKRKFVDLVGEKEYVEFASILFDKR